MLVHRGGATTTCPHDGLRNIGTFFHSSTCSACIPQQPNVNSWASTTITVQANLIVVLLEVRPVFEILDVLAEPRKLLARERVGEPHLVLLGELADAVAQEQHHADEERRDGAVRDRVLSDREPRRGQRRLELLDRLQEGLDALPEEEGVLERGLDPAVVDLNEPARLRTEDGVLGEEPGVGEEVRDELDQCEGLGELLRLGRRLLRGNIGSAVRDRRNLRVGEIMLAPRIHMPAKHYAYASAGVDLIVPLRLCASVGEVVRDVFGPCFVEGKANPMRIGRVLSGWRYCQCRVSSVSFGDHVPVQCRTECVVRRTCCAKA